MSDPNQPVNEAFAFESKVKELAEQVYRGMTGAGMSYLALGRTGYGVEPFEDRLELIGPHGEGLGDLRSGVATRALEPGKVREAGAQAFLNAGGEVLARLG